MTELLIQPYRFSDEKQVDEFYGLLSTYPNLKWIPPTLEIADQAARIRATQVSALPTRYRRRRRINQKLADSSRMIPYSKDSTSLRP